MEANGVSTTLLRPGAPGGRGSSRNSDRRDAAASARGTAGTVRGQRPEGRRACGAWPGASWSVGGLDLGWLCDRLRFVFGATSAPRLVWVTKQRLQSRQARILPAHVTRTGGNVQVRAAVRAEPLAVVAAQRAHRHREIELLAQHLAKVEHVIPVVG